MEKVIFRDLGLMPYKEAWDYQEQLLQENVKRKSLARTLAEADVNNPSPGALHPTSAFATALADKSNIQHSTSHYLLFVEHPPVFTLGKSGNPGNALFTEENLKARGIGFFHTNRGGDITFHGPQQLVGYPVLDLERFYTDIGKYLRNIEEVIIRMLAEYGIRGDRSPGETGVWIEPGIKGKERKICAIGVRSSRWVTMHGFALNVNTDLSYFNLIIPCGIQDKQVTSLEKELGHPVDFAEAKEKVKRSFEEVFEVMMDDGCIPL